jgi:hypothetical protein
MSIISVGAQAPVAVDDHISAIAGISVSAAVMSNDVIPGGCAPSPEIIVQPQHGVVTEIRDGKLIYLPSAGFVGFDRLTYRITCGGGGASQAQVYIYVSEMPDNLSSATCFTDPSAVDWAVREISSAEDATILRLYQTPVTGDIDGDGIPEIVLLRNNPFEIVIYKGNDLSAPSRTFPVSAIPQASLSLGLVRTKVSATESKTFIITHATDGSLNAYNIDGRKEWTSSVKHYQGFVYGFGFADFNHDGYAEIYMGNKVFDAATGVFLCDGKDGNSGQNTAYTSYNSFITAVGDVLGNGELQLVAGNQVYEVNIVSRTNMSANSMRIVKRLPTVTMDDGTTASVDGATSLLDVNRDGLLDVLVRKVSSSKMQLYIWTPSLDANGRLIARKTVPRIVKSGLPLIGDIDGDKYPEIIILCGIEDGDVHNSADSIYAFKYTPGNNTLTTKWGLGHSDASGFTGLTLFDFNQDGITEIVYRDNYAMRIINGSLKSHRTGADTTVYDLSPPVPCQSGTAAEYPVIADIDGDGHAEIITAGPPSNASQPPWIAEGHLRVFGGEPQSPWAPARSVWNQAIFTSAYVNDDLSVPAYPTNPATFLNGKDRIAGTADDLQPFNNVMQQQTTVTKDGMLLWLTPDVKFVGTPTATLHGAGDSMSILTSITNIGDAAAEAPLYLSAYMHTESGAQTVADSITVNVNGAGKDTIPATITVRNLSNIPFTKITVRLNDRGANKYLQSECNYNNNTAEVPLGNLPIAHADNAATLSGLPVVINVKANDRLPENCTAAVPEISVNPAKGTAETAGDNIRYMPAAGFVGIDSTTYRITCNNETVYAKIYIYISETPGNISSATCFTDPPAMDWKMREESNVDQTSTSLYQSVVTGDIDGDGIPEVVALKAGGGQLLVYKGNNMKTPYRTFTLRSNINAVSISLGLVRTKVSDAESRTFIIVNGSDGYLWAYDIDGNTQWQSSNSFYRGMAYSFGFADFNHDGYAEIYKGNKIFDAATGALLCDAGNGNAGFDMIVSTFSTYVTAVGDVLGNGSLQLVAGNQVYEVSIKSRTDRSANSMKVVKQLPTFTMDDGVTAPADGMTAITDVNLDGRLDVIVRKVMPGKKLHIYIWTPSLDNSGRVIARKSVPNVVKTGLPLIGDIDGDRYPEIIFLCGAETPDVHNALDSIYAFKYIPGDATLATKWGVSHNDASGFTGLTLFDFNQDGMTEIVYRDNYSMRIINGSLKSHRTGADTIVYDLAPPVPCQSGTALEYPVVADIDGDGHAEIVTAGPPSNATQPPWIETGQLRIFRGDAQTPWAPARSVWNQAVYTPVYVNDDLSVPAYPPNPATFLGGKDKIVGTADDIQSFNNIMQQQTTITKDGAQLWLTPDVKFVGTPTFEHFSRDSTLVISAKIANIGDAALVAPSYVAAYKNSAEAANLIAVDSLTTALNAGDTLAVKITVHKLPDHLPINNITLRMNDRGAMKFIQQECDYNNNAYLQPSIDIPSALARNDTVVTLYHLFHPRYGEDHSDTTINVKLNDLMSAGCSTVVPEITVMPANGTAEVVGDRIRVVSAKLYYGTITLNYRLKCTSADGMVSSISEATLYIIINQTSTYADIVCSGGTAAIIFVGSRNVDYAMFDSETGGVAEATGTNFSVAAPAVKWFEVRYRGVPVRSRFRLPVVTHPPLVAPHIGDSHTICYGTNPQRMKVKIFPSGGSGEFRYLWFQHREGEDDDAWNIAGSMTSELYYYSRPHYITTLFRVNATNDCGTIQSDTITVTVLPLSVSNYPDIRIRICPKTGMVNLSKYIDTIALSSIKWESVSPGITVIDPYAGTISTDNLNPSTVYTLNCTLSNMCATEVKRKVYLETTDIERIRPARDTLITCYQFAESLHINQIFGIEADGSWSYDSHGDVTPHISESNSPVHEGAVVMNGKAIYEDESIKHASYRGTEDTKHVTVTYTSADDSCLTGESYKVVIILTPN